jgi:hypothetical protein
MSRRVPEKPSSYHGLGCKQQQLTLFMGWFWRFVVKFQSNPGSVRPVRCGPVSGGLV